MISIQYQTSCFPATTSTCTIPYVSASASMPVAWDWGYTSFMFVEDEIDQLEDRKLRYHPFHIKNKPLVKSVYSNRKPIPIRQTILQPFRITRQ